MQKNEVFRFAQDDGVLAIVSTRMLVLEIPKTLRDGHPLLPFSNYVEFWAQRPKSWVIFPGRRWILVPRHRRTIVLE